MPTPQGSEISASVEEINELLARRDGHLLLDEIEKGRVVVMSHKNYASALDFARQGLALKQDHERLAGQNAVLIDTLRCLLNAFKPITGKKAEIFKVAKAMKGKENAGLIGLIPHLGTIANIFKGGFDPVWLGRIDVDALARVLAQEQVDFSDYKELADNLKPILTDDAQESRG